MIATSLPSARRAERDALLGLRPMAVGEEELLARDGAASRDGRTTSRRHRRDDDVRPDAAFAAERAADERRDARARSPSGCRTACANVLLHGEDVLRGVVQREVVAVPRRDRCRAPPSDCGARTACGRSDRPSPAAPASAPSASPFVNALGCCCDRSLASAAILLDSRCAPARRRT